MDYFNFNEDEIFDARDSRLSEYKELREELSFDVEFAIQEILNQQIT